MRLCLSPHHGIGSNFIRHHSFYFLSTLSEDDLRELLEENQ